MNQEEQIRLWLVETIHENRLVYPPAVNDLTQWGPDFAWPKLTCCIQVWELSGTLQIVRWCRVKILCQTCTFARNPKY
ncbi:hypothetical protein BRADI_5g14396v3 [Brachypodium distachyon]|uniref:Uncharacterized protein n=1 Tax=Brachypodium distachyon TaxID=15368 RepID=A0A2K2CH73_BRADI|nr:hypothetical protein BRADI_5g14396v3 [Brachypodium distachyon]